VQRRNWLICVALCRSANELSIDVVTSLIGFSEEKNSRQKIIERW
jgi:hypothetical protein